MEVLLYCLVGTAIFAGIIVLCVLYMTAPAKGDDTIRRRLEAYRGVCFAHKGLYSLDQTIPENSMPAFAAAVENGYGVDLDIQSTRDDKIICFCNSHIRSACGIDEMPSVFNYDQLQKLKLFGSEEHIPLLSDVLSMINGRVPVIIEIKSPGIRGGLWTLCERVYDVLCQYNGEYCIASFDPQVLRWFRENAEDVIRMQATMQYFDWRDEHTKKLKSFILSHLLSNCISRPHIVAYKIGKQSVSAARCRKMGAPLVLYTSKQAHRHEEIMSQCDAIVFEGYHPRICRDADSHNV